MSFDLCTRNARRVPALLLSLLFLCGSGLLAHAQNTIYTVAGGGSWSGTATGQNADLAQPSGVAKDAAGNVYIADPSANSVFKIDPSGNLIVFAGIGYPTEHANTSNGKPANTAGLNGPSGVAVDKKGNVYIADTVNYMIRKVSTAGLISNTAGNSQLCHDPTTAPFCGDGAKATGAQLNYPIGVATDSLGNLYIADTGDNKIRVVNVGTVPITVAGVTIPAGFIQTVAGDGTACTNALAGNCGDGAAATLAQLNNPQGIAVDSSGNIYVADSGDHRIRIISNTGSTTGTISPFAGTGNRCNPSASCGDGGAATAANISNPWQIALDPSNDLFIVDAPANFVREVVASTGNITTVAGNGTPDFTGDGGAATSATLNRPRGVAVDALGNVYVGDTGNQRVRSLVGGIINTFAGGGNGYDTSVATSAILGGPRGVALDSTGNLYIADAFNNRVREVTPSSPPTTYGTINTIIGTGITGFQSDTGTPELNLPTSVAVDSLNNVYVADSQNNVIRQYNPGTGGFVVVAGTQSPCFGLFPCGDNGPATDATFQNLASIALDSNGNIYAADAGTNTIRVVNMGANPIMVAGVTIPSGYIQSVAGISGMACSNPLPPNCGDNGPATSALLNSPFGVAVDSLGDIFIADTGDNRIREVLASGTIMAYAFKGTTNFALNNSAANCSYGSPHYLAIDPHGNLYVGGSDVYSVVARIDAFNHQVISVAGQPKNPKYFGFAGDGGPATSAYINESGVAVDGAGHLYIADDGNNRVREVLLTSTGTLSVTSLTFPPQTIKTTSAALSFKLTNSGLDDLYISGTSITSPFSIRSTSCTKSNVVSPTSSCTFNITYRPTVVGPVNGSITINDNAYGSPSQTVTLSGTGQ
jgi:sugar lactone lactonase YvrE